ncbi:YkgJ family cysteine cluster protein [Xanthomonas sp. MUS 060]|uniref:YkgJ family cysteine cluster protein n=1 Tax=Xanthomonas sp. MUS 060 TaxID=1588031 RepID=UPI0005F2E1F3|nr:YkgJ family cysteine cluster protein [Xanthomonas sp. MUS 060]
MKTPPAPPRSSETSISCERCDAICCRLTVLLMPDDQIPQHLTEYTRDGLLAMARDEEGWCVAVDSKRMCCSIYAQRPTVCRKFTMAGPYCRDIRRIHNDQLRRGIPLTMY